MITLFINSCQVPPRLNIKLKRQNRQSELLIMYSPKKTNQQENTSLFVHTLENFLRIVKKLIQHSILTDIYDMYKCF